MSELVRSIKTIFKKIPDGHFLILKRESFNLLYLGNDVVINPKLRIRKIVDGNSTYYLIIRRKYYILIHDDKQTLEKIANVIINIIIARLRFKDKIKRVKVIPDKEYYIIQFVAEKQPNDIETHFIMIGGKKYFFMTQLITKKKMAIQYSDFNKMFMIKIKNKYKPFSLQHSES